MVSTRDRWTRDSRMLPTQMPARIPVRRTIEDHGSPFACFAAMLEARYAATVGNQDCRADPWSELGGGEYRDHEEAVDQDIRGPALVDRRTRHNGQCGQCGQIDEQRQPHETNQLSSRRCAKSASRPPTRHRSPRWCSTPHDHGQVRSTTRRQGRKQPRCPAARSGPARPYTRGRRGSRKDPAGRPGRPLGWRTGTLRRQTGRARLLQQAATHGLGHGGGPIRDAQIFIEALGVRLDRARPDEQLFCELRNREASRRAANDL